MSVLKLIVALLRNPLVSRAALMAEDLALRQQLNVFVVLRHAPMSRKVDPPSRGKIVAIPQVGGLHHRYTRAT